MWSIINSVAALLASLHRYLVDTKDNNMFEWGKINIENAGD